VKQLSRTTSPRRIGIVGRLGLAVASAGMLFGISACGFDVQTLQPYTPSDGVNIDIAPGPDDKPVAATIKVRGLLILAKAHNSGFLSGSVSTGEPDQLTSVSGTVLEPNGSPGPELTATLAGPVQIGPEAPVILTEQAPIQLKADTLPAGQLAELTLTFERAGSHRVQVPIVDGYNPTYRTVEPSVSAAPA
jgi:hypothetical protein